MAIEKAIPQAEPIKSKKITRGKRQYVRVPITNAMRPIALALIARGGMPYEEMSDILANQYKVELSPDDLKHLATTDANTVSELRKQIRKTAEADASRMLKKVDKILNRQLDRTIHDMDMQEELDKLYAAGALDDEAYRQGTDKLRVMPLSEVLKIAEYLNPKPVSGQVANSPVPQSNSGQIGDGKTQDDSELSTALSAALKEGNAVEVQRIMFTKAGDDTQA